MRKYLKFAGIPIILFLLLYLYFRNYNDVKKYDLTTFSMGSCIEQEIYVKSEDLKSAKDVSQPDQLMQKVAQEINKLEKLISWRDENSDVYKINHQSAKTKITIDPTTCKILELCFDVANRSHGSFDPTVLPLCQLWSSSVKNATIPTDEDIIKNKSLVNFHNYSVDVGSNTINIYNPMSSLDLGAVGKGLACDLACKIYRDAGVSAAIISVGGTVATCGLKDNTSNWGIAVKDPFKSEDYIGKIYLGEGYVSTSGSYEKNFSYNGKLYHHILDPSTGYPVENDIVSVTVISNSGALSDALSTACFVLGLEKSDDLLKSYNAKAIFIDKNKNVSLRGENIEDLKDKFHIISEGFRLK